MVSTSTVQPKAYIAVLLVLGSTHLLNDLLQALIPAIYPIIKDKYALDFVQIGLITLTFQIAGSLLQPLVGHYTDQHPMPYSTAIGMIFTLVGVVSLAFATSFIMILVSVAGIGIGSSIYHPEATRMARYASGNRQGLAQGIFQVGGQIGGALSPLLAALIIVPRGQTSLCWFASLAILAMVFMIGIARQHTADVLETGLRGEFSILLHVLSHGPLPCFDRDFAADVVHFLCILRRRCTTRRYCR